jgi:putative ABC transport system permease protein
VPALTLLIVAATALVPALRAGRLLAVQALVAGRTPQAARGRAAQRLSAKLPFPRPLSLGLAQPFARPARTITVAAAVVFGTLSATFALGLESGFANFQEVRSQGTSAGAVVVSASPLSGLDGPGHRPLRNGADTVSDPAKVAVVIAAQPGTEASFGYGRTQAVIPGASSDSSVTTIRGDMSWAAYDLLSGRWFAAPGEAVVADRLASASGIKVGDTVTVQDQGHSIPLRIVGVDFDLHDSGLGILTPDTTYTALGLEPAVAQFNVELKPGSSAQEFLASANTALTPLGAQADTNSENRRSDVVITMSALVGTLTLMLVAVAALGVLNTVVQDTRERVHELGVFKALGMTPSQTVAMVLTSVSFVGLLAGLVGVPLGIAVEHAVMPAMGNAVGMHLPSQVTNVYTLFLVGPLLAGGLLIALVGAFLPAGWAAKAKTATALRSE